MTDVDLEPNANERYPYRTYGPFDLKIEATKNSLAISKVFWNEIEKRHQGLSKAIGIYIFVKQPTSRSKLKPWYVGMTDGSFSRRLTQRSRLLQTLDSKKGITKIFLIARLRPGTKELITHSKKSKSNDVLETMLIERCLELNPDLLNAAKVKHVRGLIVPGLKGKKLGKPRSAAKELHQMLHQ